LHKVYPLYTRLKKHNKQNILRWSDKRANRISHRKNRWNNNNNFISYYSAMGFEDFIEYERHRNREKCDICKKRWREERCEKLKKCLHDSMKRHEEEDSLSRKKKKWNMET